MDKPLRILHLEDDPDYSDLVKGLLEKDGLQVERVLTDNHADFLAALDKAAFDIILADYSLPTCTGLDALATARRKCPDTPFLLLSGAIGEAAAIESLKAGATDYVPKHWPERLVPAVRRAHQEAQKHAQLQQAESELSRQEKYFRALTLNSLDLLTILSSEGCFKYNSPSLRSLLGYEPEELLGRNVFDLIHLQDRPDAMRALKQALSNPGLRVTHQCRLRRRDGSWCHLETVGQSRLDDPEIEGVVLNSRDVSEREQAQAHLRLQSAALESTANGIVITDRAGTVTWVNPAFTRLTGYTREEMVGQNPRRLKSGQHAPAFYQHLWETILAGRVWQGETVNRRKDGTLYTEESTITPVRDERGEITHFVAVKQDITARKELESQLRQAQKMEGIGQLAGGVAHDFNNLLAVIRGNAELASQNAHQVPDPLRECLRQIIAASDRAADLTRQLLTFSRKQVIQRQPLDLNVVVKNLTKMLTRIIGENILLECAYDAKLPAVHADVGMIEQVLVNLVVNARDAMAHGGQLRITTEQAEVDEAYARSHLEAHSGRFVCLRVSDTGTGIAPEHLPHLFEPFFTTKQPGKGTGLGLATVHGIVTQHQGWAEVSTRVGGGTTLKIFLPSVPQPVAEADSKPVEPVPRGTGERILLVEDDLALRALTRQVLETSGYEVWEAATAEDALKLWRDHSAEIDLLLTDIIMPGALTGRELAEQLRQERPGLKMIFITGYSPEVAGTDTAFLRRSKRYSLQKPCSSVVLLRTVRQCLDGK